MSKQAQKEEWNIKLVQLKMGEQLDMNSYDEEGMPVEYMNAVRVPGGWLFSMYLHTETESEDITTHVTTTFVPYVTGLSIN